MKLFLSTILLTAALAAQAQSRKIIFSTGIDLQVPANQPLLSNKTIGLGTSLKTEIFISHRVSLSASAGYAYYAGKIVYWDDKTDNNFALIPVLAGARYYFNNIYLGFEAGVAVKASSNTNPRPALVPSAGVVIKKKVDIGLRFFAVPAGLGYYIPEATFLEKGGYSYMGVKLAYNLN